MIKWIKTYRGHIMRKHYTKELTPLKFHKLYYWVITPVNIIFTIYTMAQMFANHTSTPLLIVYDSLLLISCVLTFVGGYHFKKYAWWAIMGGFALELFYDVYYVIFSAVVMPELMTLALSNVAWRFVAVILMGIYYLKRKPLFFNPVPIEEIPEEYRKTKKR